MAGETAAPSAGAVTGTDSSLRESFWVTADLLQAAPGRTSTWRQVPCASAAWLRAWKSASASGGTAPHAPHSAHGARHFSRAPGLRASDPPASGLPPSASLDEAGAGANNGFLCDQYDTTSSLPGDVVYLCMRVNACFLCIASRHTRYEHGKLR